MRERKLALASLGFVAWAGVAGTLERPVRAQSGHKDFLSRAEANKIRDAETPNDRVHLFLSFAGDRLKKFTYELHRTAPEENRGETLEELLSQYSGCVDEASELIQLERDKGSDMRGGIKEMRTKAQEYLLTLAKFKAAGGPEFDAYKDTLDDAIEGTQDALRDAQKAAKEYGAMPVRRKP